jgi:opacity protein-like surface antigen
MNRKLLSTLILMATGLFLMAQGTAKKDFVPEPKGWTLRLGGGYAWPGFLNNEQIIGPKIDPFSPEKDGLLPMANISDTLPLNEPIRGSYGKGMNFTFGVGYMINRYIGVEMGLSLLKSVTYRCEQTRGLTTQLVPGPPPQYQSLGYYFMQANISTHALALSLMPSVIIQGAKPGWKVYPYARLGISLPVFGELTHDISIDADTTFFARTNEDPYYLGKRTEVKLKTEGAVSVGVNGALGVAYRPLPYLSINAEVNGQYLVVRAKSAKVAKWETDGEDRIAERGVYRSEFNFVDKLDGNSNNADFNPNYDRNKPKDDLRPTGPFSNLGLNVGVAFLLSKETFKKSEKK